MTTHFWAPHLRPSIYLASPSHPRHHMSTTSAAFCPLCANLLLLEEKSTGLRFCCATCPYVYKIDKGVRLDITWLHVCMRAIVRFWRCTVL